MGANPPGLATMARAHSLSAEAMALLTDAERVRVRATVPPYVLSRLTEGANFREYWRPIATGQARDLLEQANSLYWQVVQEFAPVVKKHARYQASRLRWDYEDTLSVARIGCYRAASRFDLGSGLKFTTYARYWIADECEQASRAALDVAIPVSGCWRPGRRISARASVQLDAPVSVDSDTLAVDVFPAEDVEIPDVFAIRSIRQALSGLSLLEAASLETITDDASFTAIGAAWDRGRDTVWAAKNRAIEKLKKHIETQKRRTNGRSYGSHR